MDVEDTVRNTKFALRKEELPEVPEFSMFDMVNSLSTALDYIDISLFDHHKRVAFIATEIACELKIDSLERSQIFLAAILHDIGSIGLTDSDRLGLLDFGYKTGNVHGDLGAILLTEFKPFASLAPIVQDHHVNWNYGGGSFRDGRAVSLFSHIIHLADRIAVLADPRELILPQTLKIEQKIIAHSGEVFVPDLVDHFLKLSRKEAFWLDLSNPALDRILEKKFKNNGLNNSDLKWDDMMGLSRFFALIIDVRSRFTATHSSGVAAIASEMAKLSGFSDLDCKKMKVAGYLHDLGKLSVPNSILEKNGKLTEQEWMMVRAHTYHTQAILEKIQGFEEITEWAACHHEDLKGEGYPFRRFPSQISTGARIMMVADIFTAVAEDRPYRLGMDKDQVQQLFFQLIKEKRVDPEITHLMLDHFDYLNGCRLDAQASEGKKLEVFWERIEANYMCDAQARSLVSSNWI